METVRRLIPLSLISLLTVSASACGSRDDAPFVYDLGCEGYRCHGIFKVAMTVPGGVEPDLDRPAAGALIGPRTGPFRVQWVGNEITAEQRRDIFGHEPEFHMEMLPDGYIVTGRRNGYTVEVLRHLDGHPVVCDAISETAAEAAAVLEACRSLRPANAIAR